MSKMDNLRAMREARYEQAKTKAREAGVKPAYTPAARADDTTSDVTADDGLCGHRNMGGRTCTREAGHAAKSHRYS